MDSFIDVTSTSTDLDMYYQKVGDVYDAGTGRPIEPDFPSGSLDFQTRVEEYRIVGSKGQQVGISSNVLVMVQLHQQQLLLI